MPLMFLPRNSRLWRVYAALGTAEGMLLIGSLFNDILDWLLVPLSAVLLGAMWLTLAKDKSRKR